MMHLRSLGQWTTTTNNAAPTTNFITPSSGVPFTVTNQSGVVIASGNLTQAQIDLIKAVPFTSTFVYVLHAGADSIPLSIERYTALSQYVPLPLPSVPWYENKMILIGGGVAALALVLLIAKK